ncbi:MAG: ABC transporter ATP-binding protein [Trueperaceae bacterium]|nr:ABC transporter ATP-binding protein [Trueperaceae bacterium]
MVDADAVRTTEAGGARPEPLLRVEDLRTVFHTDEGVVEAVRGASFQVARGSTLGIVGESGCGKSVAARSILQLVQSPGRIEGGRILLDGARGPVDLARLEPYGPEIRAVRGDDVAMIFQEPMSALSPVHTIGQQIVEAIRVHRDVTAREAHDRAVTLLERVRMPDPEARMKAYTFELSGGMRQRAMIAMALACDPKVLIADEPTTALDVTTQATILDLLRDLQAENDMALILITHDLGVVAEMADEVAVMYLGRVVESGPVDALFAAPRHPYTQGLLASVPRIDPERRHPRRAIPGSVPSAATRIEGCAFAARCAHAIPGRCDVERPEPRGLGSDHAVACHLYDESLDAVPPAAPNDGAGPPDGLAPPPARPERTPVRPDAPVAMEARDVDVHYPVVGGWLRRRVGTVRAVDGVSLRLRVGETVGLVGESGSGKTSFAHALVRLHAPTRGTITLHREGAPPLDVARADRAAVRELHRSVRMVFQDPYGSLDPRLPVREVIGEPIDLLTDLSRRERDARVEALLETVGLSPDVATRYVHAFSGGQRQRIGIARALATDPSVVIADEPVSALDVSVQAQVLDLLERLVAERGLTMLFVSHDLSVVSSSCDRVVVLYAGEIVEEADSVTLYRAPKHPYTEALLAAVPVPSPGADRDALPPLRGGVPDPAHRPAGCAFAARCRYATDVCRSERPSLREVGDGRVACHHAEDLELVGA